MRHRKKSGIELYFNLLSPKVELEKVASSSQPKANNANGQQVHSCT